MQWRSCRTVQASTNCRTTTPLRGTRLKSTVAIVIIVSSTPVGWSLLMCWIEKRPGQCALCRMINRQVVELDRCSEKGRRASGKTSRCDGFSSNSRFCSLILSNPGSTYALRVRTNLWEITTTRSAVVVQALKTGYNETGFGLVSKTNAYSSVIMNACTLETIS